MVRTRRAPAYDHLFKLVLVGDSGVGKGCMLRRLCDGVFDPSSISLGPVCLRTRTLELHGETTEKWKLQIWYTSGQERYRETIKGFWQGAQGVFVLYDVTDRRTFDGAKLRIKELGRHAHKNVSTFLIGNKCDLRSQREVTFDEAKELSDKLGVQFMETSAKRAWQVEEALHAMASTVRVSLPAPVAQAEAEDDQLPSSDAASAIRLCACACSALRRWRLRSRAESQTAGRSLLLLEASS